MTLSRIMTVKGSDIVTPAGNNQTAATTPYLVLRISLPSQDWQKAIRTNSNDLVWSVKKYIIDKMAQGVDDALNYGLFLPANGKRNKPGRWLDEWREIGYYVQDMNSLLEFIPKTKHVVGLDNPPPSPSANTKKNRKKFIEDVQKGSVERVKEKLMKGIDPNFWSDNMETPLGLATLGNDVAMIQLLVEHGAFLDFRSGEKDQWKTPLHLAAQHNKMGALQALLISGAWVNCPDGSLLTPLYHAILGGHNEIAVKLLAARADVDVHDDSKKCLLFQACFLHNEVIVPLLIDHGASLNVANAVGNTPLHVAATRGAKECVRWLLLRGCDREVSNKSGQTAAQLATISGNTDIFNMITKHTNDMIIPPPPKPMYSEDGQLQGTSGTGRSTAECDGARSHGSSNADGTNHTSTLTKSPSSSSLNTRGRSSPKRSKPSINRQTSFFQGIAPPMSAPPSMLLEGASPSYSETSLTSSPGNVNNTIAARNVEGLASTSTFNLEGETEASTSHHLEASYDNIKEGSVSKETVLAEKAKQISEVADSEKEEAIKREDELGESEHITAGNPVVDHSATEHIAATPKETVKPLQQSASTSVPKSKSVSTLSDMDNGEVASMLAALPARALPSSPSFMSIRDGMKPLAPAPVLHRSNPDGLKGNLTRTTSVTMKAESACDSEQRLSSAALDRNVESLKKSTPIKPMLIAPLEAPLNPEVDSALDATPIFPSGDDDKKVMSQDSGVSAGVKYDIISNTPVEAEQISIPFSAHDSTSAIDVMNTETGDDEDSGDKRSQVEEMMATLRAALESGDDKDLEIDLDLLVAGFNMLETALKEANGRASKAENECNTLRDQITRQAVAAM